MKHKIAAALAAVEKHTGRKRRRLSFTPASRDFDRNRDVAACAFALLSFFEDIKPHVLKPALDRTFDLKSDWGIDPEPLFNLNAADQVHRRMPALFGGPIEALAIDPGDILNDLKTINTRRLLGKFTGAKMAYLKPITRRALRYLTPEDIHHQMPRLLAHTIELLRRQEKRLAGRQQTDAALPGTILKMARNDLLCRLKTLFSDYPGFADDPGRYYQVYSDEIAQMTADFVLTSDRKNAGLLSGLAYVSRRGIETAFSRRDPNYLFSGDHYAECTAFEVRSQVDPAIANIHWTVYAWLLDPYYSILDVYDDGRRMLKGHLLPLIVHDRRVLMIDAIETVPALRDYVRGRVNENISKEHYARRNELLEALFEKAREIARRMDVDAVYIDKYSNTRWVRTLVNRLPSDSYNVREVIKPYGSRVIESILRTFVGETGPAVTEEVQARNLKLMDQQLKYGYKEIGVLSGRRKNYYIPVRGI